ncbi:PGF-pre-PGF domain-containing protein [Methanovulcanius yangii]|uniref:PGF-pre-PGF domain-containing protein n=1 Tax=Methanovulcanius yangii TaxID=1789227 RepID=UPI0029CA99AD|nr:PGF-pre-PGF domain-containing protein [Methanovulcanius yangii]
MMRRNNYPPNRSGTAVLCAFCLFLCVIMMSGAASATPGPINPYNNTYVMVANDAGAKYDDYGDNTYLIQFKGATKGLKSLHISDAYDNPSGESMVTDAKSGTFFVTSTDGTGYYQDNLLLVAVNGTIADDFSLTLNVAGYNWTVEGAPLFENLTYEPNALDETFTAGDFGYGPQTWKPAGAEDYPLVVGQDMSDTTNTFHLALIDLNVGALNGANANYENCTDLGAIRVDYAISGLGASCAFNAYAYTAGLVQWTNDVTGDQTTPSGLLVMRELPGPVPVSDTYVWVANDAGARYDIFDNGTYRIKFKGEDKGLNSLHLAQSADSVTGEPSVTDAQSGTFYVTSSAEKDFWDELVLMVAVGGDVPADFTLALNASGYVWTAATDGSQPDHSSATYTPGALDESFGKADLFYGPQYWKPTGNADPYPIYHGQDMTDTTDNFSVMFVDLNCGLLHNSTLTNNGFVQIDYAFTNLPETASFNLYGYSNQTDVTCFQWTNRLDDESSTTPSGYIVQTTAPVPVGMDILPASWGMGVGDTVQFIAHLLDSGANAIVGALIDWESSVPGVGSITAGGLLNALSAGTTVVTASSGGFSAEAPVAVSLHPIAYNTIFVEVANDDGPHYDDYGNGTYFIGEDIGYNSMHITTNLSEASGQVTTTEATSGTFYLTDTGGKGYKDDAILMIAVNGTVPADFALTLEAAGYQWTPNVIENTAPPEGAVTYNASALAETFTVGDFMYGPQYWKPADDDSAPYPIFYGQDMTDLTNTFSVMFVDLNCGILGKYPDLENGGAVQVDYSVTGLESQMTFNLYGYCKNPNAEDGSDIVLWTNSLAEGSASGYSVVTPLPPTPTPTPTPVTPSGGGSSSTVAASSYGMTAGVPATLAMPGSSIVHQIVVTPSENVNKFLITVRTTGLPSYMEGPDADVWKYLLFTLYDATDDQIGSGIIEFTVPASWFTDLGYTVDDIRLMRYVDGVWVELPTTWVGTTEDTATFTAETPGFSYFAIAAMKAEVPPPITTGEPTTAPTTSPTATGATPTATGTVPATEPTETPAPVFAALGGLGAAGLLLSRRESR